MMKKNLKNILLMGGFGVFALVNALILSGLLGVSLNPGTVFGYGGGGGGGGGVSMDYCPNGDNSGNYYDRSCGSTTNTGATTSGNTTIITTLSGQVELNLDTLGTGGDITNSKYSGEMNLAYLYAYRMGITNKATIESADLDGYLNRIAFAKMVSVYATKVAGLTPNPTKQCNYKDIKGLSKELQAYAVLVCKMEIMGVNAFGETNEKFNPYVIVTKSQSATILSRIIRGKKFNVNQDSYYTSHIEALKKLGIMEMSDLPKASELRGIIMTMMYRANQKRSDLTK